MAQRNEPNRMIFSMFMVMMLVSASIALSGGSDAAFVNLSAGPSGIRSWFGPRPAPSYSGNSRECVAIEKRERSESTPGRWVSRVAQSNGLSMSAGPPRIIIAGAPASGKGTQCSMIKERYGVVHLSTGDMLRQSVKDETEVGMKAKGFMDEGKLVPDEVIIDIVRDRLAEEDCQKNGWLLDGFPRTRAQADALQAADITADIFLLLNVPDEVLISRVVGRRLDPETGDIYHLEFNPPSPEIADRLIHRADDTEEKAKVRLDTYHANIAAIQECYEEITYALDGAQPKSEVFGTITSELEARIGVAATVRGGATIGEVETEPIEGMKPGTSGLRKKETA